MFLLLYFKDTLLFGVSFFIEKRIKAQQTTVRKKHLQDLSESNETQENWSEKLPIITSHYST